MKAIFLERERERERGQTGVVDVGAADKEPLALNGAGFEAEGREQWSLFGMVNRIRWIE